MIIYFTREKYRDLLNFLEEEQALITKPMVGEFSLSGIIRKQLRNLGDNFSFLAIDRGAMDETDQEFVKCIRDYNLMFKARVVVIQPGLTRQDDFTMALLKEGVTNLVTAKSIEAMKKEIRQCFSDEGMSKYMREGSSPVLLKKNKYTCTAENIHVGIAGFKPRCGATTIAINMVDWINSNNGKVCYLDHGNNLTLLVKLFNMQKKENMYMLNGINFASQTDDLPDSYNIIVHDFGVLNNYTIDIFNSLDLRILCANGLPFHLVDFREILKTHENLVIPIGIGVVDEFKDISRKIIGENLCFFNNCNSFFEGNTNEYLFIRILNEYMKE